jgi:hypothetical protein
MVNRDYDLFEVLPDGSSLWRGTIQGQENALNKLRELFVRTTNELRLRRVSSNTIILTVNSPEP